MPLNDHTDRIRDDMSLKELEIRAAGDMYEIHRRLSFQPATESISSLVWVLMSKFREAFRTAENIQETRGIREEASLANRLRAG